jgi:outer membrane protein TolC
LLIYEDMLMRDFIVVLGLVAAAPAHAERVLTLADALSMAKKQSRDLEAGRARVDQAKSGIDQALAALLPNASAQGKYTHNYKEVDFDLQTLAGTTFGLADVIKATSRNPVQNGAINAFEQGVAKGLAGQPPIVIQKEEQLDVAAQVTVPLIVPAGYPALSAAKKTTRSAEANYAANEANLLLSAAQAFFAAAGADELVAARGHAVDVAKKTRDDARARFNAGVVNRVEVMRAELALQRAEQSEVESEDLREQAYRALATLLVFHEPFKVAPGELPSPRNDRVAEVAAQALTLRPEIAALDKSLDAARAQASSAAWRWAPTLSAFGNVRAYNYTGFSGDKYAWAVGLQLDWLLYDGGARDAARKLANAQAREDEARLLQLRDTISDDVYNAERAVSTKRRALMTADSAAKLSQETLSLVRAQHDAGTATQLDLLQAQDALVSAEVGLAQARFDLQLSDLNLQRIAGTFPAGGRL